MREPGQRTASRFILGFTATAAALLLPEAALAQPPQPKPGPVVGKPQRQGTVVVRKTSPAKHAARLIRQLELPERSSVAWRGILSIGAPAAEPLAIATHDPRKEVAMRAFLLLAMLREEGMGALPILEKHIAGDDESLQFAASWAKDHIEFRGRLLTDWSKHTVIHLDDKDEELRKIDDLKGPWHAEPCGNGNLLISEYGANRVRVIDKDGKVLWKFDDLKQPYHAMRLPTGNTLISDASNNRVIEVDLEGKIVWKSEKMQRPVAATRLPDGHTLIVENSAGVVELDRDGKEVLRHKVAGNPMRAIRLLNGNTLVTSHGNGTVLELDLDGKEARPAITAPKSQAALRRRNGHTLISSTTGWFELDAKGKEIWRRNGSYAVGVYW